MESYTFDDQLLIDLLIKRDIKAFKLLYDTYSPSLHGSIIDIVAQKDLAAQILEQAFFTAWETINSYDQHKEKLFTWMLHIARRISIQTLRAINSWPSAEQLCDVAGNMRAVLKTMNRSHRQVIELMYYKGLSKNQVAEILNIPVDTVTVLLQQGMAQLFQRLKSFNTEV
jgi:RNA polymerase sigma-70 factor (ECF subfamily)